jgi:hypothetical protein
LFLRCGSRKEVKLPEPEFIVLYNGDEDYPEKSIMTLSDAFQSDYHTGGLKLDVMVYNVKYGKNKELMAKSNHLKEYSMFIDITYEYKRQGKDIKEAIKFCIDNNILREYLLEHESEVFNMLNYEFNLEIAKRVEREEGREKGKELVVVNLVKKGVDMDLVSESTGISVERIHELLKEKH